MTPPFFLQALTAARTALVSSVEPSPAALKSRLTSYFTGGFGIGAKPAPYPEYVQSASGPELSQASPLQPHKPDGPAALCTSLRFKGRESRASHMSVQPTAMADRQHKQPLCQASVQQSEICWSKAVLGCLLPRLSPLPACSASQQRPTCFGTYVLQLREAAAFADFHAAHSKRPVKTKLGMVVPVPVLLRLLLPVARRAA